MRTALALGLGLGLAPLEGAGVPEGNGFIGMNFNSLEYAWGQAPGSSLTAMAHSNRMRIARIPTAHERWVWGTGLGGALNAGYVSTIRTLVTSLRSEGYWALLELHNNGRFDPEYSAPEGTPPGNYDRGIAGWDPASYVLGSADYPLADLTDLWGRISAEFSGEVDAYGIMNEPHDLIGLNQIDNGNSFTGDNWYTANGAVLTPNAGTDPYGGNNAWSMTSGSGYGFIGRAITIPNAQKTSAIWVRTLAGTAPFSLSKDYDFASAHTATTAWQKLPYTFTGGANGVEFSLNSPPETPRTVLIYMAQLNDGPDALDIGGSSTWELAAQAAADAIRANDTDAYLVVNGDAFGNAATYTDNNSALDVQDAQDKIIYDVHHYLDGPGTYSTDFDTLGITDTTGAEQAAEVIAFMESQGFRFIVGETGIPLDEPRYLTPFANMIDAYQASPNCVGIVYWNVLAHQAGDPEWFPNPGGVSIQPIQEDQSRFDLLKSKAKSDAFAVTA